MKKVSYILLVLVLMTSLFVGCGETQNNEQPAQKNNQQDSTQNSVQEKEPVDLTLYFRSSNVDIAKKAVAVFEEKNLNISINVVSYPNKDYRDKLMVQLAGGGDVDVYDAGNNAWYADFVSKRQALPLEELIKRDNFDVSGYGPSYEQLFIGDDIYALPVVDSVFIMFYNKDLFDEAGVPYPKKDMTWKEFRVLAKKMTKGKGNDKIWGAYFHTWPQCWYGYGLQTGATIIDEDLSIFGEALQYRLDLEKDGSIMPYTEAVSTNAHYNQMFQTGKVAMNLIGNWHIGQLREAEKEGNIDFDWDIVSLPHPEGVSPNTTFGMTGQICIQADTKYKEESWELVKFMSGPEGAKIFAKNGRLSGYKNDEIKQLILGDGSQKPENIKIIFEQKSYLENPTIPNASVAKVEIFKKEAELTFVGERSVEDTMKVIKKRIQEEVKNQ